MKVVTSWNLGNFAVGLEAEIDSAMAAKLQSLGLRYVAQRNSEVDKILGGFEKNAEGKLTRIAGFKRNDVAFDESLAEKLAASFETLDLPDEGGKITATPMVSEYVREVAGIKFAEERKVYARNKANKTLDALATKVGFKGEQEVDGEPNTEFLRSIREYVKNQL